MPEGKQRYHVSSAVIVVRPQDEDRVLRQISAMSNVEVHGVQDGKMVVVIDGYSSGQLGEALSTISAIDGVVAANMVFEHSEELEGIAHEGRTDAA
ncbi:chaperone NapD [Rhizobium puerariae]|uniref:Chaperone NapD n=1 Tax=Rhizobium puerariae TaxID=1585791 RepID=A0ABV6AET5_9HYPH